MPCRVMSCQDVDEREGDIRLMKEELEEAQEREKEADVVLKVIDECDRWRYRDR